LGTDLPPRARAGDCAKQTQFAAARDGGAIAPNKANFGESRIGAKVFTEEDLCRVCPSHRVGKTKPILTAMPIGRSAFPGSQTCETKPIRAGGDRGVIVRHRLDAPLRETKPIRKGVGRGRPSYEERIVRNKPNSQGRAEAMDVESATVCRPHPRPVAGHFLFESPSLQGV